ncbi:hypothetical protein LCGC14_0555420 [marine sediment metagenome]|uniref:Uncharacterized protein n=1 Tax=marine sediment metagenome TaxID=412755 RepID=A0A0F9RTM8_9ZZZZ
MMKVFFELIIKGGNSLMIEYSIVYNHNIIFNLLYNLNGFSESGFGNDRSTE